MTRLAFVIAVIGCGVNGCTPPSSVHGGEVTVISLGREPRQALTYALANVNGTVSLTWSRQASYSNSERGLTSNTSSLERTLTGAIAHVTATRSRLDLLAGTDVPPHDVFESERSHLEVPDFAAELPMSATLDIDAHHLVVIPAPLTGANYAAPPYFDAIAAALPRDLPPVAVGPGATWRSTVTGDHAEETTWTLVSITGSLVELTGTARGATVAGEVTAQIDLATLAVTAKIVRRHFVSYADSFRASTSSDRELATLTITPK